MRCCVFVFFLSGCGKPTYPKEVFTDAVKKICVEDFDIDVDLRIVNKSLGVLFKAPNLIDGENKLTKNAKKSIDRILQTLRRVRLSSDIDIDYLSLQVVDSSKGYQITATRFFDDVLRVMAGTISISDFQLRTHYFESPSIIDFSPLLIKKFEKNLYTFYKKYAYLGFTEKAKESLKTTIDETFLKDTVSVDQYADIFNISDLDIKNFSSLKIETKKQMILNKNDMLFFIKFREISHVKEKYEASGKNNIIKAKNNYAVLLKTSYNAETNEIKITEIYRLKQKGLNFSKFSFPEKYSAFENIDLWKKHSFWVEDMFIEKMLVRQIAKRSAKKYNLLEKQKPEVEIKGLLLNNNELKFIINDDKEKYNAIIDELKKQMFIVCKKYKFYGYSKMHFFTEDNRKIETHNIDKKIFAFKGYIKEAFGRREY